MQEVASLPRVEVILPQPQFRDFVNGVMLFEIALTVNPLAFDFGIRRGLRTCASAFAGGLSSSITVWAGPSL